MIASLMNGGDRPQRRSIDETHPCTRRVDAVRLEAASPTGRVVGFLNGNTTSMPDQTFINTTGMDIIDWGSIPGGKTVDDMILE